MIPQADRSHQGRAGTWGADAGATLLKLARRQRDGRLELRIAPIHAIERAAREVEASGASRVGLTGGGATELAGHLHCETARIPEFDAWATGAGELLRREGRAVPERYLLVSLGTGTSALLVEGELVSRAGGTALGGGTLLGLGVALTGATSFEELVAMARRGDRRTADLLVSDVYRPEEAPLPGFLIAASFARLAQPGARPPPEDLAQALVGLVGENVARACFGLAVAAGVKSVVYGGSSLRANPPLEGIVKGVSASLGIEAIFPKDGEYAGALGALLRAER